MIVTGNKLIRWSLKEILTQEGLRTDVALTTRDDRAKIADHSYDLIIVDAESRTTDPILEQIDEMASSVPIIILSALANEQKEAFLNRPNVFSVIEKPFSVDQIKDAALAALASPRPKEENNDRVDETRMAINSQENALRKRRPV